MSRWAAVVVGALTFLGAHGVLVARWRSWFDQTEAGLHNPWFLNSGRAVAFTAACLLLVSAAWAATMSGDSRERIRQGAAFSAGGVVAMTGVLLSGSPGTLLPVVLVIGAAIVLASGIAGAMAGGALRRRR